jgi:hypothetical protein
MSPPCTCDRAWLFLFSLIAEEDKTSKADPATQTLQSSPHARACVAEIQKTKARASRASSSKHTPAFATMQRVRIDSARSRSRGAFRRRPRPRGEPGVRVGVAAPSRAHRGRCGCRESAEAEVYTP